MAHTSGDSRATSGLVLSKMGWLPLKSSFRSRLHSYLLLGFGLLSLVDSPSVFAQSSGRRNAPTPPAAAAAEPEHLHSTWMGVCPQPTSAQVSAETAAGRNPMVLVYQSAVCARNSSNNMVSLMRQFDSCVRGSGDQRQMDMNCFSGILREEASPVRVEIARLMLGVEERQREQIRTACPTLFGDDQSIRNLDAGMRCLQGIRGSALTPPLNRELVFNASQVGGLRSAMFRVGVAGQYCANNGRVLPGAEAPPESEVRFPAAPPSRATAQEQRRWNERELGPWLAAYGRRRQQAQAEGNRVGSPRLQECEQVRLPSVSSLATADLTRLAGSGTTQVATSQSGAALGTPGSGGSPGTTQRNGTGTGGASGQTRGTPIEHNALTRFLNGLLSNVFPAPIRCEQTNERFPGQAGGAVCPTCNNNATRATDPAGTAAVTRSLETVRQLTVSDIRLRAARQRALELTQAYLGMLTRQPGLTPAEFSRQAQAALSSCANTAPFRRDLDELLTAANAQFERASAVPAATPANAAAGGATSARPGTAGATGATTAATTPEAPRVSGVEANRRVYMTLMLEAANRVTELDRRINTILGDFTQMPSSLAENWEHAVRAGASRVAGSTVGQYAPPLCGSYLRMIDIFRQGLAPVTSNAPCGGVRQMMADSDVARTGTNTTRGASYDTNAPLTAADRMLQSYEVPRMDPNTGEPVIDRQGRPVMETRDIATGSTVAARCQAKEGILNVLMAERANLVNALGDLTVPVDAQGNRSTESNARPLYTVLQNTPENQRESVALRHMQASGVNPELERIRTRIADTCSNPNDAGAMALTDNQWFNRFMSCETEVPSDVAPEMRAFVEREVAGCRQLRSQGQLACQAFVDAQTSRRPLTRDAMNAANAAMEVVGIGFDAVACTTGISGLARGIYGFGSNVAVAGLRRAVGTELLDLAATITTEEGRRAAAATLRHTVFNRTNYAFMGHTAAAFAHNTYVDLPEAEIRYWTGLASGEEVTQRRQERDRGVLRGVGNVVAGGIVAHFMSGGGFGGNRTSLGVAGRQRTLVTPRVAEAYERAFGEDLMGQVTPNRPSMTPRELAQAREAFAREARAEVARLTGMPESRFRTWGADEFQQMVQADAHNGHEALAERRLASPEVEAAYRRAFPADRDAVASNEDMQAFIRTTRARLAEITGRPEADFNGLNAQQLRSRVERALTVRSGTNEMHGYLDPAVLALYRRATQSGVIPGDPEYIELTNRAARRQAEADFVQAMKNRLQRQFGMTDAAARSAFGRLDFNQARAIAESGGRITEGIRNGLRRINANRRAAPEEQAALVEIAGELTRRDPNSPDVVLRGLNRAIDEYCRCPGNSCGI